MKQIAFISVLLLLLTSAFVTKKFFFHSPTHFPKPVYAFDKTPITNESIQLGRALFYDPILSRDSTISCASCHSSYNAFAHTDHSLSHGIRDGIGTRNAPALINLAWQNSFMWDGAINHLDVQALAPISHPKEMDESIAHVADKLKNSELYRRLFKECFEDGEITGQHILQALAHFQLTLVSADSKYDRMIQRKVSFNDQEIKGYELFQKHCNTCHREPLFSTYEFRNNGLPFDSTLNDYGKGQITHASQDSLLFKIPTLRNLAYTYPYMHDGRFKKLSQVLNHYTDGIQKSKTLASELKEPIVLSKNEKADLIAFLQTLSDSSFVFNPEYAFPKGIFGMK